MMTVHELSGGRAVLGLGPGGRVALAPAGVERREPLARARAALRTMRAVTRGERGHGYEPEPNPFVAPTLPLYIGSRAEQFNRLASAEADGVFLGGVPRLPRRAGRRMGALGATDPGRALLRRRVQRRRAGGVSAPRHAGPGRHAPGTHENGSASVTPRWRRRRRPTSRATTRRPAPSSPTGSSTISSWRGRPTTSDGGWRAERGHHASTAWDSPSSPTNPEGAVATAGGQFQGVRPGAGVTSGIGVLLHMDNPTDRRRRGGGAGQPRRRAPTSSACPTPSGGGTRGLLATRAAARHHAPRRRAVRHQPLHRHPFQTVASPGDPAGGGGPPVRIAIGAGGSELRPRPASTVMTPRRASGRWPG
jgi:hypothetical protein